MLVRVEERHRVVVQLDALISVGSTPVEVLPDLVVDLPAVDDQRVDLLREEVADDRR